VSSAVIYPRARKFLIEHGRSAENIAALPVSQVALMYGLARYAEAADDYYKLNNLPYWEIRQRIKPIRDHIAARDKDLQFAFGRLFFNPQSIYRARARLQRRVDLLRCVEAVRLYAVAHGGALPASLEAISEVPIPVDPMTGKAFRYTRDGERAILEASAPPGEDGIDGLAVRFEMTMAPAKK
jgi:hypothetical protein